MSSSYDSVLKWAKEAKALLKKGNLDGVKTNLSMIIAQAKDAIKENKKKIDHCLDCGKKLSEEKLCLREQVCDECDDGGESDGLEYGVEQWED